MNRLIAIDREKRREHARDNVKTNEPRNAPVAGHELKGAVGARDQPFGKCDALRLVAVEEAAVGAALDDRGQFPRQVDRVADAGVHALAAHGTVDVRGVTDEKRAPDAEMGGDAMMNMVGGKPVHALHVDAQSFQDVVADVAPLQRSVRALPGLPRPCR